MTWREFVGYFDPHIWQRVPDFRLSVCRVCRKIESDRDTFREAR